MMVACGGGKDGEAHRHAVIAIALNRCWFQRSWCDAQPIVTVFYVLTNAAKFIDRRDQAIGFFDANIRHVANGGWPFAQRRDGGQRHHGVADMVHIDVDTAQRFVVCDAGKRNSDLSRAGGESTLSHRRAHQLEDLDKTDVALQRMLVKAVDGDCESEGRS